MLTPRSYILFFRYFNFVLVVLHQFWYQSKHQSVETSLQERARKYHPKKKKNQILKPTKNLQSRTHNQVSKSLATTKREETHIETHRQPRPTIADIDPLAAESHRLALSCHRPTSHHCRHYQHTHQPSLSTPSSPLFHVSCRRCLSHRRATTVTGPQHHEPIADQLSFCGLSFLFFCPWFEFLSFRVCRLNFF